MFQIFNHRFDFFQNHHKHEMSLNKVSFERDQVSYILLYVTRATSNIMHYRNHILQGPVKNQSEFGHTLIVGNSDI